MRADVYLYSCGYTKSREKARSLIENGCVKINSSVVKKPSFEISENSENTVEIIDICPFVSRGGLKLDKMLSELGIDISGLKAVDIGASTGGFTDCLLKKGVSVVYAVDSGHDQLDEKIASDERVISIEGFNARNIANGIIPEKADIVTLDVSFISQTYIIPEVAKILADDGVYISLIKPQFEVGRENISKNGIVKNKKAIYCSVLRVIDCAKDNLLNPFAFIESPIKGGDGNTEYLCAFSRKSKGIDANIVKDMVLK